MNVKKRKLPSFTMTVSLYNQPKHLYCKDMPDIYCPQQLLLHSPLYLKREEQI